MRWMVPEETYTVGEPWHLRGSLLALDIGLGRLALRRTTSDLPQSQPRINDADRRAFITSLVLMPVAGVDQASADRLVQWVAAGAEMAGTVTPSTLDAIGDRLRLDERRRAAVRWTAEHDAPNLSRLFLLSELASLGRPPDLAMPKGWGPSEIQRTGCYCLGFADPPAPQRPSLQGATSTVASVIADLQLKVLSEATALHLPAIARARHSRGGAPGLPRQRAPGVHRRLVDARRARAYPVTGARPRLRVGADGGRSARPRVRARHRRQPMTLDLFRRAGVAACLALVTATAGARQAAPTISILSPGEGTYVTGSVVLQARPSASASVREMTFFADGRSVCTVIHPPFDCPWEAGAGIREHVIRVVATTLDGSRLVATVRTKSAGYTESVDVDVVQITATVTDASGHFVKGLKREQFKLKEDGVAQRLTSFVGENIPLELVVATDVSDSMTEAMPTLKAVGEGLSQCAAAHRPGDAARVQRQHLHGGQAIDRSGGATEGRGPPGALGRHGALRRPAHGPQHRWQAAGPPRARRLHRRRGPEQRLDDQARRVAPRDQRRHDLHHRARPQREGQGARRHPAAPGGDERRTRLPDRSRRAALAGLRRHRRGAVEPVPAVVRLVQRRSATARSARSRSMSPKAACTCGIGRAIARRARR